MIQDGWLRRIEGCGGPRDRRPTPSATQAARVPTRQRRGIKIRYGRSRRGSELSLVDATPSVAMRLSGGLLSGRPGQFILLHATVLTFLLDLDEVV